MIPSPFYGGRLSSVFRFIFLVACVFAAGVGLTSQAQSTLYWDGDGVGTVDGDTGTWNTSDERWSETSDGSSYISWDNTAPNDNAVFQDTAGIVTLGTDIDANSLTFGTTGYTLAGSHTLTLSGGAIDTGAGDQIISAVIGGNTSISKSGSGELSLTGTNTFSGTTTISAGTLRGTTSSLASHITNNAALIFDQDTDGTFSNFIIGAGTLEKTGSGTVTLGATGAFTGSTTITEGSLRLNDESALVFSSLATTSTGTLSFGSLTSANLGGISASGNLALTNDSSAAVALTVGYDNADTTYSGMLSGSGSLNKTGTGTLTLAGANSYTGGTTITFGTLSLDHGDALGPSGDISFLAGVLQHTANNTVDYSSRLSNTAGQFYQIDTNGQDVTYASALTSAGGILAKSGEGTLTLTASNTFTGSASVTGGTLALGHATDTLADSLSVSVTDATLALGSNSETVGAVLFSSADVTGSGTLTTSSTSLFGTGSISTILAGSGTLAKSGAGTYTLTAANTYTGFTVVDEGTLRLDFAGLSTPTNVLSQTSTLVQNGGTLEILGKSIGTTAQTFDLSGYQAGDASITVDSNGGTATTLALTSILRFVGGTVDYLLPANGSITTSNTNTNGLLGGYATIGKSDWATVSSGAIVAATYTDDTWAAGNNTNITTSGSPSSDAATNSLRFGSAGAQTVNLTGDTTIESGGILVTSAVGDNTTTLTGGTVRGAAGADLIVINHNPDNHIRIASTIVDHTSATGLTKSGQGVLVLAGANTYTGVTQINNGTLQLGADHVIADTSAISLDTEGVFDLSGQSDTVGSLTGTGGINLNSGSLTTGGDNTNTTFNGVISGAGGLTKSGTGTLTLAGINTHTGTTTVSGGSLAITGTATSSAFTVAGGTLTGTGNIGALTIGSGGTLSPGFSPGTFTAASAIWQDGGTIDWELNSAAGIVGSNWDLLNITGGLSITATDANPFSIDLVSLTALNAAGEVPDFDANTDYSWTLVTTTGGISFDGAGSSIGASLSIDATGFQNTTNGTFSLTLLNSSNDLALTYTTSAVPEPGTFALLVGLITLGFTATRRRRS